MSAHLRTEGSAVLRELDFDPALSRQELAALASEQLERYAPHYRIVARYQADDGRQVLAVRIWGPALLVEELTR